jgi:hypothetical protein
MTIAIHETDQKLVNQLRIDLAQASVYMAEVQTHDFESHQVKEKAIQSLRTVRDTMDQLGIKHSGMLRYDSITGQAGGKGERTHATQAQ